MAPMRLAVAALACAAAAAAAQRKALPRFAGVNLVAEGFEGPFPLDSPETRQALVAARESNATHVSLSFTHYVASINSTGPIYAAPPGVPTGAPLRNASSPTAAGVAATIDAAHAAGLAVIVRPMIDPDWNLPANNPDAIYRGDIGRSFSDAQWDAFFVGYSAWLLSWARLAETHGAEAFCLGAELSATEAQAAHWRAVSAAVRAVFSGHVFYSATSPSSPFPWDVSDVVGLDVYPSLALPDPEPTHATLDQLVAAWAPTLAALNATARAAGKPVLLAETGICSIDKPGLYSSPAFFECYSWPVNQEVQALFYQSVFAAAWSQPFVAGAMFWKWAWAGGAQDHMFFPLNKTAQAVMAAGFGGAAAAGSGGAVGGF